MLPESLWRATVLSMLACMLTACLIAPVGALPPGCSGVPSDPDTPRMPADTRITHGPGGSGEPILLRAVKRPPGGEVVIPWLYVYDDAGVHVSSSHPLYPRYLSDPVFERVERSAYWGEVVDTTFYLVPELDSCSQAAMVEPPLSFEAPRGGLLFVQFVAPGCEDCIEVTAAIEGVIAAHPTLPVRWVRIDVPREVGVLRE